MNRTKNLSHQIYQQLLLISQEVFSQEDLNQEMSQRAPALASHWAEIAPSLAQEINQLLFDPSDKQAQQDLWQKLSALTDPEPPENRPSEASGQGEPSKKNSIDNSEVRVGRDLNIGDKTLNIYSDHVEQQNNIRGDGQVNNNMDSDT
ncbi:MAG: hypothetical protein AAFP19_25875 [Bacteroidota bacterium]